MSIAAIIGLGNPGEKYRFTRHNVGFWLADYLAKEANSNFKAEKKILGDASHCSIANQNIRLLKPQTYMNDSGQSLRRMMDFFKLQPENLLVVHDELDLSPGINRFKYSGGHGGHNGLRDIINHCGRDFLRLRIGIGHPGDKSKVTGYVLHAPNTEELDLIEDSFFDTFKALEMLLKYDLEKAMHFLHTEKNDNQK
ncbi:MAG: aminoacyl-tRNA hydrolase [Pseudomonadota bacterium]|nr:aminoacyl-tRNA hydrolase [Pseudomonadota bacterium]